VTHLDAIIGLASDALSRQSRPMNPSERQLSRFLSLVLRHAPESLDLQLDESGWARVSDLIDGMKRQGKRMDLPRLVHLVDASSEKRFEFSDDGLFIRATTGHSILLQRNHVEQAPPRWLYHGTSSTSMPAIVRHGIGKQSRDFVHLWSDRATAKKSAARHDKAIVLEVAAQLMVQHGYRFFVTENHIWLTDHVPPDYLNQRFSQ